MTKQSNMTKQFVTRHCSFDSMHRVLHERYFCRYIHGHTYLCDLCFEFTKSENLGYAIDFKEIKRVGIEWIMEAMDHNALLNEHDFVMIEAAAQGEDPKKPWLMSLNGAGNFCNPSVENISREIFLAMEVLFSTYKNLKIHKVTIHETPNCFTECIAESISEEERKNWTAVRGEEVAAYAKEKGMMEYDDRKLNNQ